MMSKTLESTALATVLAISLAIASYWPSKAHACAGCSNPNLPAGRGESTKLGQRDLSATIHLTGTIMHVVHSQFCPDIGPICQVRDEPGQMHDQTMRVFELRPIIAIGLSQWFGAELQVPVRVTNTSIQFTRIDGTPFTPDYESIHHRNETLSGIADPWLLGRGTWEVAQLTLTAKGGVSIPLGNTVADPFELGDAGKSHQHIQFGTGTFSPILGVDVSKKIGRYLLGAYGQTQLSFYENGHGYQAGNRYIGGLSAETEFEKLRVGLGTDLLHEEPERWSGVIKQDGNVGRTDLLAGGTVGYKFGRIATTLSLKVPIWQTFLGESHHGDDPGQLTYPAIVNIAVQTSLPARK